MKRAAYYGCAAGILLALAAEAARVLLGGNFHTLVPGRVYRSAQLSDGTLEAVIRKCGIRTVVNLRGVCDSMPWYLDECRVTNRLGVSQEDIGLSAGRLPGVNEMRRLVDVLDNTQYPILFHCKQGADRTGMASAIYLLLHTDTPLAEALRQLGVRDGHVPFGKTSCLDRFFNLYVEWLQSHGLEHAPAVFRRWITVEYCPAACRCSIEPIELPTCCPCGEPIAVRIRFHNTSVRTWTLRQDWCAGIHAYYSLLDEGNCTVSTSRAGLFSADVLPGESIDLTFAIAPVWKPGTYRLIVDMIDEQQCTFAQEGSEPLEQELIFRE